MSEQDSKEHRVAMAVVGLTRAAEDVLKFAADPSTRELLARDFNEIEHNVTGLKHCLRLMMPVDVEAAE